MGGTWDGPETSSVMVALRSDFVRGPDVGGLAASSSSPLSLSSLSGRARGDGSLVHLILVFVPLP